MKHLRRYPLLLLLYALTGCTTGPTTEHIDNPVVQQLTIDNIDTCQGVFVWEGSVWLYGSRDGEGIIKQLEWVGPNDNGDRMLIDTGAIYELKLYRNRYARNDDNEKLPRNVIPRPTGLTHHPDYDAFIGNTDNHHNFVGHIVNQTGTIYAIHFLGLTESGSLDDWIMNKVVDDLATNGTRPEFVRYNGRWLVATADNGKARSQLRLYDPEKLKTATKTSDPGVLVAAFDSEPFVQSMHWIDNTQTLVLAQSQAAMGDRITVMTFGDGPEPPTVKRIIDLSQQTDELTGFAIVAPGWAVMTSATKKNNVSIIRWPID